MNPDHKAIWTDALRSKQYRHAKGFLCIGGSFCYLGVLGDLVVQGRIEADGLRAEWKDAPGQGAVKKLVVTRDTGIPDTSLGTLPIILANRLGLRNGAGLIPELVTRQSEDGVCLADLNDSGEFTPGQIADLIDYFL